MIMPPNDSVSDRYGLECDQIVDEFIRSLCANNPERLFHYTSAEGFNKIIEDGTLWATNLLYMNDPTEVTYGIKKFKKHLKEKIPLFTDA